MYTNITKSRNKHRNKKQKLWSWSIAARVLEPSLPETHRMRALQVELQNSLLPHPWIRWSPGPRGGCESKIEFITFLLVLKSWLKRIYLKTKQEKICINIYILIFCNMDSMHNEVEVYFLNSFTGPEVKLTDQEAQILKLNGWKLQRDCVFGSG